MSPRLSLRSALRAVSQRPVFLPTLLGGLALAAGCAGGGGGGAAAPAATEPAATAAQVQVGGTWRDGTAATASAGAAVGFLPAPRSGGSWRWSGCGLAGTERQQAFTARTSCTATATHTAEGGATSTQSFTLTVPGLRALDSAAFTRLMGAGWNLGNSLEAIGGETAWGNPATTPALLQAVKAAGFQSIRIPVAWKQYADANDNISATWMARVQQVVDQALAAGLVVMINVHWDGGWMQPTYAQQAAVNARLAKFWTQIATHFQAYDDRLLFAGTNEVMKDGDYGTPTVEYHSVQNSFNQTFVSAVRATGGNNLGRHLVVQGFNTNIDHTLSFAVLPTDSVAGRLAMEVHYYDPYNFTINENSSIWQWGAQATLAAATETWANEAYLDAQFRRLQQRYVAQGVGVIVGEYGVIQRAQPGAEAFRQAWLQAVTRSAWQQGLVPMVWDNGVAGVNGMGLFDRRSATVQQPALVRAIVEAAR